MEDVLITFTDGHYALMDLHGQMVRPLGEGDLIELRIGGTFQAVQVCGGGYKGWWYFTEWGQAARFALGMRARD